MQVLTIARFLMVVDNALNKIRFLKDENASSILIVLVAERFRIRLDANAALIRSLLAAGHHFTVDESARIEYET